MQSHNAGFTMACLPAARDTRGAALISFQLHSRNLLSRTWWSWSLRLNSLLEFFLSPSLSLFQNCPPSALPCPSRLRRRGLPSGTINGFVLIISCWRQTPHSPASPPTPPAPAAPPADQDHDQGPQSSLLLGRSPIIFKHICWKMLTR